VLKLYLSPASPFVRKVMICAHELGLADQIELLESAAHPVNRDERIAKFNPLAKVPAALTKDGMTLFDSRVICEYLAETGPANDLFPKEGGQRWSSLTLQALADGIADAALLARYERTARPEEKQWPTWTDAQINKIDMGLHALNEQVGGWQNQFAIGQIGVVCALGYLDFRFPAFDWRSGRGSLSRWYENQQSRASVAATMPRS